MVGSESLDSLPRMRRAYLWSVAAIVTLVACGSARSNPWREVRAQPVPDPVTSTTTTTPAPTGVYAAVTSTQPAAAVADIPARVYV
ncbi:MAG: hypothetical protein JWP02_2714, partial [Acidimicrobiales bacterium]|nr:hypothetical protein [Acidimicrobiales bacterium]